MELFEQAKQEFLNGLAALESGNFQEAEDFLEKSLALLPERVSTLTNLAAVKLRLGKYEDALYLANNSVILDATNIEGYLNIGNAQKELGQLDDALESYNKAASLLPNYSQAEFNKSIVYLLSGNYEMGLKLYEHRWQLTGTPALFKNNKKLRWTGVENIQNKTVLLYAEQGLGDTIQFIRYARMVKDLGSKVIVQCQAPLLNLLKGTDGIDQLITNSDELPEHDFHAPLGSLPLAFKSDLNSIPFSAGYIKADPQEVKLWKRRLPEENKLKIGITWSSASTFKDDLYRSMRLREFVNCLPENFCTLVCLQKVVLPEDMEFFSQYKNILFFGDLLHDFSDTAALASNLDLVVSTCTSVPHMAAALGLPTWILLKHVPDWRWMLHGTESRWYQSVKLYRQDADRSWNSVLPKVRNDLLIQYSLLNQRNLTLS